jgi:type II secretory pathway component PulF
MSVFAYTALNKEGRLTSGTLASDTRAAAIAEMSRRGLHAVSID